MAKFLANENVPREAVQAIRQAGHDLNWIAELSPGADDVTVLAMSLAENRVLLTFDEDFGELAFREGKDANCGIILFRPRLRSPDHLAKFAVHVLAQEIDWEGNFSVAREGRLRVVRLK